MERANLRLLAIGVGIAAVLGLFFASLPPAFTHANNSSTSPSSFFVVFPRYTYPQSVREIAEVDFRNLAVPFFKPDRKCCYYSAKLANGYSFVRRPTESDEVVLLQVNYFDFHPPDPPSHAGPARFAAAVYGWMSSGGSASGYGAVNVFEVINNRLILLQQIDFIAQTPGTGAFFDPSTRTLRIIASHYGDDPHCCPSHQDIVEFRWTPRFFQKTAVRTIPYVSNSNDW
jgi:hypothetical protein